MKKIINLLPAMAILLASGLAVAGHLSYNDHNVKNTAAQGQPPIWELIEPDEEVNCSENPLRLCTGYMDGSGNILDTQDGNFY